MYKTRILIISSRKELSIKYKKLIELLNQDVIYTNNLSYALNVIQKSEVEFIIISDTIKEKIADFIKKIRVLTYNFRPIIIAVSKSNDLSDKLEALEAGADDFLGEEISKTEFQTRFKAHLRRYLESSLNPITGIPDKNITKKALKKSFEIKGDIFYLLLKIKNIEEYQKTHGEIAQEKVLQTLCAIVNSVLSQNDFLGHIEENEFILITNITAGEKIASFLAFAFDNILNKFYSSDEFKNNFIIQSSDNTKETKTGLMRLNIAGAQIGRNKDYREIIQSLKELVVLLEDNNSSSYIIDRVKLKGEISKTENSKKVLIFEPDSTLGYLLKNVCEINGIIAQNTAGEREFDKLYTELKPDVVILDWGAKKDTKSLSIAKKISKDNIKLIFSSSFLNKKEILKSGADLYIPKPYEIDDMIYWIKKFLD